MDQTIKVKLSDKKKLKADLLQDCDHLKECIDVLSENIEKPRFKKAIQDRVCCKSLYAARNAMIVINKIIKERISNL